MNRRDFIRLSTACLLLPQACRTSEELASPPLPFPISVLNDMDRAHRIMQNTAKGSSRSLKTKTLIVGGGIAGLSAAAQLAGEDFLLCELSDRLGGSAGCGQKGETVFSQGAHYDLIYPDYFGQEALSFLAEIGIVTYDPHRACWAFVDEQFMVSPEREERAFVDGKLEEDSLMESEEAESFFDLMQNYHGQLRLPSRLINPGLRNLDSLTFAAFLAQEGLDLPPSVREVISHQLIDDFGAGIDGVSAIAGLYYYANRPYLTQEAEIFSPPQGNYYFAEKILANIPGQNLLTGHLVTGLHWRSPSRIEASAIDLVSGGGIEIAAERVVYAAHKHALTHVMPQAPKHFSRNQYAPWAVVNILLKKGLRERGFWQNEAPGGNNRFLGFVDSDAQHCGAGAQRVLTAYYCFLPDEREQLVKLSQSPEKIVGDTLTQLAPFFKLNTQEMAGQVDSVFVKVMGHGMPIPIPGYLFQDANQGRPYPNMVYAGTDNSRLPLLLEAIDSGILAVQALREVESNTKG